MYIDIVLCRHPYGSKTFLFQAPAWSGLTQGDDVIVDTINGTQPAQVAHVYTVEQDSKIEDFVICASGAYKPLKRILKRVIYRDFDYPEEDENAD